MRTSSPLFRNASDAFSIAIIHHELAPRKLREGCLASCLGRLWMQRGIEVHHLRGTKEFVPANLAILHVDLSVVPPTYASFAARYPKVLNGTILDIRKRSFSKLFLQSPEDHHGPVIVKSNLNAGGWPERLYRPPWELKAISFGRRILERVRMDFPWSSPATRILEPSKYEVYSSSFRVPPGAFHDPRLIVEKFVPERRGWMYCHRRYYFLGDAEVSQLWLGHYPICANDENGSEEAVLEVPVPQELRDFRREMGIDFGKIDYALGENSELNVFDVNKTPFGFCPNPDHGRWLGELCEDLQGGIQSFFDLTMDSPNARLLFQRPRAERQSDGEKIC